MRAVFIAAMCSMAQATAQNADSSSLGPDGAGTADPEAVRLCGAAHNVTAGGSSPVTVWLEHDRDGQSIARAHWPGPELIGRFTGALRYDVACALKRSCRRYDGVLSDLEAGGFPPDARAEAALILDFDHETLDGRAVYHIAELPGYPQTQYGYLTLGPCAAIS